MPFYQCFKTRARVTYCSSSRFRSHAEGAVWVGECLTAHGLQGNDLLGKPFESEDQPDGAVVWPGDDT
jgi:hypothetical protein